MKKKKTKTLCAKVTEAEKKQVQDRTKALGITESEYITACCIEKKDIIKNFPKSKRKKADLQKKTERINMKATEDELSEIDRKAYLAHMNRSDYLITCGCGKEIIVVDKLKEFGKELHKVGTNLNQITLLCHQGLIQTPDITETLDYLKKLYAELNQLNGTILKLKK